MLMSHNHQSLSSLFDDKQYITIIGVGVVVVNIISIIISLKNGVIQDTAVAEIQGLVVHRDLEARREDSRPRLLREPAGRKHRPDEPRRLGYHRRDSGGRH